MDVVASLCLIGASVLWASAFVAMKVAVTALPPLLVILARMFLASIVLALIMRLKPGMRPGRIPGRDWLFIGLMALCEPGLYFVFEAFALTQTTASQAGMVASILPPLVGVMAFFILSERLRLRAWAGFGLAMAGVAWLSMSGQVTESAPNPLLGNFLEFVAMACAAGYMVCLKSLVSRYSPWFLTTMQAVGGTLFFLPGLFTPWGRIPSSIELEPLLAVLYLGLVVTVGAYGLYNIGLSRISAGQASAYINLIPIIAVFMGCLILGDPFSMEQVLASVLVMGGVLLSQGRGAGS